jgi:FkbM family methyltransferase
VTPFRTIRETLSHPGNQGRALSAVGRYLWWQLGKRTWMPYYDLPFHGLRLRCYPDSHSASAALYFSGLPDYPEMRFMQRYLRRGDVFLDVGANIGVYSLLAASLVGDEGSVHAFEPNERTYARLIENKALNQCHQLHCHRLALAGDNQPRAMTDSGDDCTASFAFSSASASAAVDCVALDEFLRDTTFAMAKFDIEGAEPIALGGSRAHLNRGNPPVLQLEMDGYSRRFGVSTDQLMAQLMDHDYRFAHYDAASNRLGHTLRPWEHGTNALAIRRDRWDFVLARLTGEELS